MLPGHFCPYSLYFLSLFSKPQYSAADCPTHTELSTMPAVLGQQDLRFYDLCWSLWCFLLPGELKWTYRLARKCGHILISYMHLISSHTFDVFGLADICRVTLVALWSVKAMVSGIRSELCPGEQPTVMCAPLLSMPESRICVAGLTRLLL